jgi:hypothetical protein
VERVRADGDAQRGDGPLDQPEAAVPRAPPHQPEAAGVDAAHEEGTELAVLREEPVAVAQRRDRADLGRLLAPARGVEGELALALEVDELLVERPGGDHRGQHRRQPVGHGVEVEAGAGHGCAVGIEEAQRREEIGGRQQHVRHGHNREPPAETWEAHRRIF